MLPNYLPVVCNLIQQRTYVVVVVQGHVADDDVSSSDSLGERFRNDDSLVRKQQKNSIFLACRTIVNGTARLGGLDTLSLYSYSILGMEKNRQGIRKGEARKEAAALAKLCYSR